jgi:hypothetical protein
MVRTTPRTYQMTITEVLGLDKHFGTGVAVSNRRVSAFRTAQKVDASSAVTRATPNQNIGG